MRCRARFRATVSRGQWARWSQGGYFFRCGYRRIFGFLRRLARALPLSGGDVAAARGVIGKDIIEGGAQGQIDIVHRDGQAQIDQ